MIFQAARQVRCYLCYLQSVSMANRCPYDSIDCFWVTADIVPEPTSWYENRKRSSLYNRLHGGPIVDLAVGLARMRCHGTGRDPFCLYAFALSSCRPDYDVFIPGQDVPQTLSHQHPRDRAVYSLLIFLTIRHSRLGDRIQVSRARTRFYRGDTCHLYSLMTGHRMDVSLNDRLTFFTESSKNENGMSHE